MRLPPFGTPLLRTLDHRYSLTVLEVLEHQPSWIKITFPEKTNEHLSILRAMTRARQRKDAPIEKALAEWEKTISSWRVIWINLDFVVYTSRLELDEVTR